MKNETNDENPSVSPTYPDDPNEPPFSEEELEEALRFRNTHSISSRLIRRDRCPHTPPCPNVLVCIEEIAWYRRHQAEIENGTLRPNDR